MKNPVHNGVPFLSKYVLFVFAKKYKHNWAMWVWLNKSLGWGIHKRPRDEFEIKEFGPGYFWTFRFGKLFVLGKSVNTKEK